MTTCALPKNRTFRYLPGALPVLLGLGIFFLWALYRIVIDPFLLSPKGLLILAIGIGGNLAVWLPTWAIWQMHWRFSFTPTHLIAVHWLRRQRFEIPWEAIIRVSKLPRRWWARGGGGLGVSQIETIDGKVIPFMTHLMLWYQQFLAELQARAVNCRSFDPYRTEWDR